jgi:environmental stress-induced protein Ves
VAEFRGDHGGSAEVMRAPVEDLNLMLRRSSARGSLRRVRGINLLHATVSGQQVFIHALQACTVCVGTKRYALCSGDTAQLYAAHAAESSITLDGTDIDVAVAEITMLADSA